MIQTANPAMPLSPPSTELDRYRRLEILGEGTYGVVYRAIDRNTSSVVAMKKIRIDRSNEGIPQTALREVSILQEMHHPNVMKLLNVICSADKLYLVFEFMNQDLKRGLEKNGPFDVMALRSMWFQLLNGLYFCHRHRIIHRDIKPANILLGTDYTVKLADFGLARAFQVPLKTYTHEVVTLWYRAPEILLGEKKYSPAVDIWSLGCVFAEMTSGKILFRGDSEIGQLFEIFKILGTPKDQDGSWRGVSKLSDYRDIFPKWRPQSFTLKFPSLPPDAIDLLQKMLRYDPAERITAKEALQHPFFSSLDPIL